MAFLRCPLGCLAALAVYVAVNVGAGALHHHHAPDRVAEGLPAVSDSGVQRQTCQSSDSESDEGCLLCNVLHLAQVLPLACDVETSVVLTGKAFPTSAIKPLHHLESTAHARAPPVA
jgi:hypothetical protein